MASTPADPVHSAGAAASDPSTGSAGSLERLGVRFTNWAERWFPDAYVFVALAVAVVAVAALLNGASTVAVVASFGDGFWSLITFTLQMTMIVISTAARRKNFSSPVAGATGSWAKVAIRLPPMSRRRAYVGSWTKSTR